MKSLFNSRETLWLPNSNFLSIFLSENSISKFFNFLFFDTLIIFVGFESRLVYRTIVCEVDSLQGCPEKCILVAIPHRGKTNQPQFVYHVAEYIAGLKSISLEEVAKQTTSNFLKLFSKIGDERK